MASDTVKYCTVKVEFLSFDLSVALATGDMDSLPLHFDEDTHVWSLGLLTARQRPDGGLDLISVLLHATSGAVQVWTTPLASDATEYPSVTAQVPQAHWFERSIHDFFGIRPTDHPRYKSLLLHEAWPDGYYPLLRPWTLPQGETPRRYEFLEVEGEGVYEIPVGPVHAGIIEPGHFRFSCLGEIIENLEIRLGYQHRGLERQMVSVPWRQGRFLADAASSDTTAGHAWAHAMAIESLCGLTPPAGVQTLRAMALEIERVANHVGDLGGIAADMGFNGGATIFGRLRGRVLGLAEMLSGSRFLSAYIAPGGYTTVPDSTTCGDMVDQVASIADEFRQAAALLMENSAALDRMEGIGRVRPDLASTFGLVGPARRACGEAYDVRRSFQPDPYASIEWQVATARGGDVLARVQVRVAEVLSSLHMLRQLSARRFDADSYRMPMPERLPPDRVGLGLVEAWRGELLHLVFTDGDGHIDRYCIKDPSFNNWTGLAIAARGNLVSDFPLCNKSFSLSYSGNDL